MISTAILVDILVILLAVGSAQELGYFRDGHIWLKALPVVVVTLTAFYLAGLYEKGPQVRERERARRFALALSASGVLLAFLGFAAPPLRLPRLAFLHIIGIIGFGWALRRGARLVVSSLPVSTTPQRPPPPLVDASSRPAPIFHPPMKEVMRIARRALDITLSLVALLLALPVMEVIAVLVKLDSRGPIVVRETRMRAGGQSVLLYRFRCMSGHRGGLARTTTVGRWLRDTRLDELPTYGTC